ncbi:amidohydrolase family protein [Fulvivirgaceae bacterium BMA10]|uniref:Amidohydrolase family protein n=1 Tax=Splendidivirga corallicola TaxID=3051826 RepID=A0ABT8KXV7_9BACT|nr:amidohydrolase family protein [Fulvivirgaceae bacterium BMA10]
MRIRYIVILIVLTGFGVHSMNAQTMVMPAKAQERSVALVGGTAHIGNGTVIQNATVLFSQGKIESVASGTNPDANKYEVIDVKGKHVYPGFILPNIDLGLTEVSSVRATIDNNERGQMNPNVRSIIAYNTDSELIPTLRFNGILTAQTTPRGGLISGSSSVVQLDAWNWEDAAFKIDDGIHINWPGRLRGEFDFETFTFKRVPNERYKESVQDLTELFDAAAGYATLASKDANVKLQALIGLFDGSKQLFIHTNSAKEIIESIKFAQDRGVKKIVLVGGRQAYLVRDFLKDNNIPVILDNVHRLPNTADTDVKMPYKLPHLLTEAGILVGLGYTGVANSRNLPFYAGTAAAYGLGKEKALQSITLNTAMILGINDKVGTLENGKDATLFVSEGDALDMRTNKLTHAYIQGRLIQLDATQQALYKKYKYKYENQSE